MPKANQTIRLLAQSLTRASRVVIRTGEKRKKNWKNTINSNLHMSLCLSVSPILSHLSANAISFAHLAVTLKFRAANIVLLLCAKHIYVCMWCRLLHRSSFYFVLMCVCVFDALLNAFPSENKSPPLSPDKFSYQIDLIGRERERCFFLQKLQPNYSQYSVGTGSQIMPLNRLLKIVCQVKTFDNIFAHTYVSPMKMIHSIIRSVLVE